MSSPVPPPDGAHPQAGVPFAPPVQQLPPLQPVPFTPLEDNAPFHRLYRAVPGYRWWRPLIAAVLFAVFAGVAILIVSVAWFATAIAAGALSLDDMLEPGFEDRLMATANDISNPLSLAVLLLRLIVLIPLVPAALAIAGIRPVGVSHSVTFRLRWKWMLWCTVPALVITSINLALPWILALFTGETITPVAVDPGNFVVLAIIIVLLVPFQAFAEELVFRGMLMQVIGAWVKWTPLAAILTTALFTVGHTQYEIWGLLSVAIMGFGFVIVTLRTGGLEAATALHVINNVGAFLMLASGIGGTTQMGSEGSGIETPLIQLTFTVAYVVWVEVMARRQKIARVRTIPAASLPAEPLPAAAV